jgi:hypothetical protein
MTDSRAIDIPAWRSGTEGGEGSRQQQDFGHKSRDDPMNFERVSIYWPEILSIIRIVVSLLFLEHGSAKLLGFPASATPEPTLMTLLWL